MDSLQVEFRRDDSVLAHRARRLAGQLLVRERALDLGGVEEGHAAIDGSTQQRDALGLAATNADAENQPPTAEGGAETCRPPWPSILECIAGLVRVCRLVDATAAMVSWPGWPLSVVTPAGRSRSSGRASKTSFTTASAVQALDQPA
jgi:hypothetical protein